MARNDIFGTKHRGKKGLVMYKKDRIQLLAMKTFLDNVPDMKEDINVNVKHHISADTEFLNKIQARKEALLNLNDDAIDVEVEENGL